MSIETIPRPTTTPEAAELPEEPEVNAESNEKEPSLDDYMRQTEERVANLLDAYADLKAKNENLTRENQDMAFATYEENIAATAEREASEAETDEASPEEEEQKEKKKRVRKFLGKMGKWAINKLESNGIIPLRGTWHKRDGFTGFIAKSYVYAKQRRQKRIAASFLSPEANAELNDSSPEEAETEEDETSSQRVKQRIGRAALTSVKAPWKATRSTYKLWKNIKNVADTK